MTTWGYRTDVVEAVGKAVSDELEGPEHDYLYLMHPSDKLGGEYSLKLDSLNLVNISVKLEDQFKIKFPKSLGEFKTVGDIVRYVENELGTSTGTGIQTEST